MENNSNYKFDYNIFRKDLYEKAIDVNKPTAFFFFMKACQFASLWDNLTLNQIVCDKKHYKKVKKYSSKIIRHFNDKMFFWCYFREKTEHDVFCTITSEESKTSKKIYFESLDDAFYFIENNPKTNVVLFYKNQPFVKGKKK